MRLIDADTLSSKFGISDSDIIVKEIIDDVPTIDAVYSAGGCCCRECRKAEYDGGYIWCGDNAVKPNDFCSFGERKKDDHEVSE